MSYVGVSLETHKPFCLNHDDARYSQLGHWTPVSEGFTCEACPAFERAWINEVDVDPEKEWKKIVRKYRCESGAFKIPLEYEDKDVVQKYVDGRSNDQDEKTGVEESLSLRKALPSFKDGIAWCSSE